MDIQAECFLSLDHAGWSLRPIAKEVGCGKSSFERVLKDYHYDTRDLPVKPQKLITDCFFVSFKSIAIFLCAILPTLRVFQFPPRRWRVAARTLN
jgi:hypothetical protein